MTWDEFKNWITTRTAASSRPLYWRGQRDNAWGLETTFHRRNRRVGMALANYRSLVMTEVEYYYHYYFGEILELYDDPNDNERMKLVALVSFLGQLQHLGFPTPLLDWTLSPYMAAYFAFREIDYVAPQNQSVRVFVFDAEEYTRDFYQEVKNFSVWNMWKTIQGCAPFVTTLKPMPKNNPRIVAQQGRFTVTNTADMLALITDREKKSGKRYLWHQDIEATEKLTATRDLNLMGINEMTLFPDFEGLCRAVAEKHFLPKATPGATS